MKARLMLAIASAILMAAAVAEVPKTAAEAAVVQQCGAASFLSALSPDEVDQLYGHFSAGLLLPAADQVGRPGHVPIR